QYAGITALVVSTALLGAGTGWGQCVPPSSPADCGSDPGARVVNGQCVYGVGSTSGGLSSVTIPPSCTHVRIKVWCFGGNGRTGCRNHTNIAFGHGGGAGYEQMELTWTPQPTPIPHTFQLNYPGDKGDSKHVPAGVSWTSSDGPLLLVAGSGG